MIIYICAFTEKGFTQIEKLKAFFSDIYWNVKSQEEDLTLFVKDAFSKRLPLIFVGATGIAVRTIAPFITNKMSDSPVLVMDEMGKFIIPVLSGHVGGANKIAHLITEKTGAESVITTATDNHNLFAIDVFAIENGFTIVNKDGIKKVSSKILNGEKINIKSEEEIEIINNNIPSEVEWKDFNDSSFTDVLISSKNYSEEERNSLCLLQLKPKKYCAGIGCKKGKSFEELNDFIKKELNLISMEEVYSISSIDLKKEELGLMTIAQYYNIPFYTYSAEELNSVKGDFTESDFVAQTTGVSNVCERAAALTSGNSNLVLKKISSNGMTLALGITKSKINFWKY